MNFNFTKDIILPFSDFITGYNFYSSLKFLEKSMYWGFEKIYEYQNEQLKKLIRIAFDESPYYRKLFNELNIHPNDIKSKSDLIKLPILTKDILRREIESKSIINVNYKKYPYIIRSSSGSTGEPLFYMTTKKAYSLDIAANIRGWEWMGYKLGEKFIKISQNPRKKIIKMVQDKLSKNLYLSINPISKEHLEEIVNKIIKYNPDFLRCYPDPLYLITKFMKVNSNPKISIKAINTTGNVLTEEIRLEIEKFFNCKIFDSYSCEGTPTAFECSDHTHYHFADEYGIIEILDNNNKPVNKGIGRVISTDLYNYVIPFIRYDTQDLVEVDDVICTNGIILTKVKRIIGRNNDVIKLNNGKFLIVHNFTVFFQTDYKDINKSIKRFQVIKRKDQIIFNLIVNENYNHTVEEFIRNYWEKETELNVIINKVEEIKLTKSGKHKFIIVEE